MSDWHAEARRLRAEEGLTVRAIAARLGKSRGGVQYALEPEKDGHRPCVECGRVRHRRSEKCQDCWDAEQEVRRTLTEGMWAAGWPCKDIAAALGWSASSQLPTGQWRDRGWDLPYRYGYDAAGRIPA